jgi:hypothetical protein
VEDVAETRGDRQERVVAAHVGIPEARVALLLQAVRLADGRVEVDGERPRGGTRSGGSGATQSSRLTTSSWRAWAQLKLRRKVPRVEGQGRAQRVPEQGRRAARAQRVRVIDSVAAGQGQT